MPARSTLQRALKTVLRGALGGALSLSLLLLSPLQAQADALPAAAPAPISRHSESCAPISSEQVAGLFERWNQALASGDPEQVSALYSADALLLPTLSARPRSDHAAITDYFTGFLAQKPEGRIESRTIRLGCNEALDAGTYSFLLHPAGAEPRRVQARYTFVYVLRDGTWQILHHHSSLQPPT